MLIRIGYDIAYEVSAPTPMLLMLYVHPERVKDLRAPERLIAQPAVEIENFTDFFGNRCAKIVAPPGLIRLYYDTVIEDSGLPEPVYPTACQHPVEDLPTEVLPFLLGSRYCEVEKLNEVAWQLFGTTQPGWPRVQAICDWVHQRITFGYEFARDDRTAWEVFHERRGVCRDFMHLAVAFCRCLNIPARYATGYLGDIGVPPVPSPMDFSAFFQVYLEGRWHPFDARHNERRIGRVAMGYGRDAVDVALTTTFGKHVLRKFQVWTDEIEQMPQSLAGEPV
ncbi:MAG TPA: transglutaminase family protein [Chthoniobacteraceae bacterium]|jgi:transglutaminase-like putative cysteine protease|nr:transglutaminase family protein [Chthoniobacteraceae bacterium]